MSRFCRLIIIVFSAFTINWLCFAGTTGRVSGTVKDPSGAVVPRALLAIINTATGIENNTSTDARGFYAFPSLPVGSYTLSATARGFRAQERKDLGMDADSELQIDLTLPVETRSEDLTVSDTASQVEVETTSTQMGQVVSATTMTSVALNGRSFTDLLALQPGIVPMSTQTLDSIVMAGASVAIAPSGGLNPGNQSISGQREDANGFVVNGGDVKELMNGGTSIVPNLDSIAEFRVLTNNFDAEYGNYSGGIVNVVTKSGGNELHGSAFEFLRNTSLDARNFYSPERSFYRQNQFGGTAGGPIRKNKAFYFGDYQGTRTAQGIDTGLIAVPTASNRTGNFADSAGELTGTVGGPYFANLLTQKLGYQVREDEPYYTAGCTSNAQCVFPNAVIPQRAWSAPARNLLQYIPVPNNGPSTFTTSSHGQTVRDDKGSFRADTNSSRWGLLSGYYFFDDYRADNPYPTGQGGATVPGFNALNLGRAQLVNIGLTKTFGAASVNEFRISYMRNANNVGEPSGGVGPSLASQGFVTGVGTSGIVPLAPSIEGVETIIFNSFTIGTPTTNLKQANNTYALTNNFSRVFGLHTLKAGLTLSMEQVNVNPNPTFNGSFQITGSETGSDLADFLIGIASNYDQADAQAYYGRHKYAGGFVQDSWRFHSSITVNYGLRWDLMQYWSEKYNQNPTFIPGQQSKVYPTAPVSLVYPGDAGVPNTLVPQKHRFSPRIGVAWSPRTGLSIRAGYGLFYSVIEGNTVAIDEPQPPYGLSYTSPAPPLLAEPFRTAATGSFKGNPFPLTFPPLTATLSHPNPNIDFSPFLPQAGMTATPPTNTYPYNENYFFSIEKQLPMSTLLGVSYVGSQAHHLLVIYSANPGIASLCLAIPACGPFSEETYETRRGLGSNFGNDAYDASIGNSNYNSLEATLRHSGHRVNFALGYTFSKSIDQASSISDPINPFNYRLTRALSAFDLKHSLVLSYEIQLAHGWALSGITRASSGFPVTLRADGDNSLMGSNPNGVNTRSLDLPDYNGSGVNINSDVRSGLPYFNVGAYSDNALGTPGNASRRSFYGPGQLNFDVALLKSFAFRDSKALQFRLETFNTFNHAQFFGPASVNGDVDSRLFGQVVKAAAPRLVQAALKFTF